MRAAVLSVVQQQKLATCTALLKEVAMVYGFALHIDPEVGEAAEGNACSTTPFHFNDHLPLQEEHIMKHPRPIAV